MNIQKIEKLWRGLLAAGLVTIYAPSFAADVRSEASDGRDEHARIAETVFAYFDAQGSADRDRLSNTFDEAAAMYLIEEKTNQQVLRSKPIGEVIDTWSSNPNAPGVGRSGEILSMHVVDGQMATVMFRFTDQFYDALTLVKLDGEWKIATKVFIPQN